MDTITRKFVKFMIVAMTLFLIVGLLGLFVEIWPVQVLDAAGIFVSALVYGVWLNLRC